MLPYFGETGNRIVESSGSARQFEPLLRRRIGSVRGMTILKAFTAHPQSVGETYLEHMGVASRCGASMVVAGLACIVHALLPFMFVRTASDCLTRLYQRMVAQRSRLQAAAAPGVGVTGAR